MGNPEKKPIGGYRPGSGRKKEGRKNVLIRLLPDCIEWLDARRPIPRGVIVEGLVKMAQEALDE